MKKNKRLSDLLEEYYSDSTSKANKQPLFIIEIVYTVPTSEKRKNNKSLQLFYRTKVIHKINRKTNKIVTIETEELEKLAIQKNFYNLLLALIKT